MNDELFARLESFSIDAPGIDLRFHERLACENGWTVAYSRRVVAEYRRFVWLAAKAGHPVTPSVAVDEAWHLHLCYTRSYHDEMCGEILGRALHHDPTRGGVAEGAKFWLWYERTLQSYRLHFGEEPPADIWPAPALRFRRATVRKVDANTHWIVPKPTPRTVAAFATTIVVVVLGSCGSPIVTGDVVGSAVVLGVVALVVGLVVVAVKNRRKESGDGGGGGCGPGGCGASGCGAVGHGGKGHSGCGSDADGGSGGDGGGGCGGGGD